MYAVHIARSWCARLVCSAALCIALAAGAQIPLMPIPVGTHPWALAVDPAANRIYVANYLAGTVSVIDGASHQATTLAVGANPIAVAVNPATGKVYVANATSGTVTVIHGAATTPITVGTSPISIAVNTVTNRIYVANQGSATVSVIDGATDAKLTDVAVGSAPRSLAVDPVTDRIYVANASAGTVTMINGANHATAPIAVGSNPQAVAVDPVRNRIYVANAASDSVSVIDGPSLQVQTVAVGDMPQSIVVNPATGKVYVANAGSGTVTMIEPATLLPTHIPAGGGPYGLAVDGVANQVYATNFLGSSITVIDGATNAASTLPTASGPRQVAVNPVTNRIYAANSGSNSVTVIDGAAYTAATMLAGKSFSALGFDPIRNRIYTAHPATDEVTVVDGATHATVAVPVGDQPVDLAVDPVHDRIYVANLGSATVTVIDGAAKTTSSVGVGGTPKAIAVNPSTRQVYVATGTQLVRIDGYTLAATPMLSDAAADFSAVAVNVANDGVYVADSANDLVAVGSGSSPTFFAVGVGDQPAALAVDLPRNRIYAASSGAGTVAVIDAATLAKTTVTVGLSPREVVVDPVTNKAYVACFDNNSVSVIDGATLTAGTLSAGLQPESLAVDPVRNRIFVANAASEMGVIDGATGELTLLAGHSGTRVVVNPVTGRVYLAGTSLAVLMQFPPAVLDRHVASVSMPGGQLTSLASPVLTLGWAGLYAPANPPVSTIFHQLDTAQSAFSASGSGPFAATLAALPRGQHYVAAHAADAMQGTFGGGAGASTQVIGPPIVAPIYAVDPPVIANASPLPSGHPGVAYSQLLTVRRGVGGGSFAVTSGALPTGLSIGADGTIAGTTTQSGTFDFTVTITDMSGGSGSRALSIAMLTGPAISTAPAAAASLGTVAVGYSAAPYSVVVSNLGDADLAVGTPSVTGTYAADFAIASSTCQTVAPAGTCLIRIVFNPSSSGYRAATLSIPSNDAALAVKQLSLSGSGTNTVDTTPDAFAFTDLSGVPIATVQVSAPVTLLGINAPASIAVTGGSYSIGCTDVYVTAPATIFNGQAVCVRHTSAPQYGIATHTVLTVGGVSDTFTSTTMPGHTLTVSLLGTGAGTVTGPGIDCPGDCAQLYGAGGVVSLVAAPAAGSTFGGWGGACAGTGQCTVTMDAARTVTATFTLDVSPNPPRLGNISTRMQVLTGNDVMIGGFVIGGSANKTIAIVATGPSLAAFGITNPLANPTLRLVRSSDQATLATNDDWQAAANAADLTAAGFAPTNTLEAAILIDLPPGAYTAIVEGAGGGTGVAVVGVYEVTGATIPLINISTRGRVLTGNDVMIGGFVIGGAGSQTVAIVATGPSLASFGIASPLANPTIRLVRSSDQATLATNDDWQADANAAQLQAAGFAPTNSLESGLYVTLPPGAYTVIVEGVGGGTGVAVIGVYAVN